MARARNIKPAFFTNDLLADVEPLARLLFIGLWTIADREGRMEDRPRRIKAEVLPYDNCDTDELLNQLADNGFILRYTAENQRFIQVLNFTKHQNPHMKEAASTIPAPVKSGASTVQVKEQHSINPADSLNPITDSGYRIPDSGDNARERAADPTPAPKPKAKKATQISETWMPSDSTREWAKGEGFTKSDVDSQILRFVDHWRGKGETRKDWDATFKNWMRNAREWGHLQPRAAPKKDTDKITSVDQLFSQGVDDEPTGYPENFHDSTAGMADSRPGQGSDTSMDASAGRNGFRVIASRSG